MTTDEKTREEEERRRREILNRGGGASVDDKRRTRLPATPARSIRLETAAGQTSPAATEEPVARAQQNSTNASATRQGTVPTPWRLWTAAQGGKTKTSVAQTNLPVAIDESKKEWFSRQVSDKHRVTFEWKACIREGRSSNTWVWTCLKEH
jgi:hypothetical protein